MGGIWDWVQLIEYIMSGWEAEEIFLEFSQYLNTLHDSVYKMDQ